MKKYFLVFTSALLFGACQKNIEHQNEKVLLAINPNITVGQVTKALIDDDNIESQEIGIQITNTAGDALYPDVNNNLKLSFAASWGLSTPAYLTNTAAKIYAYYPYAAADVLEGIGSAATSVITIPSTQVQDAQIDYLYAAQATTVSGGGTAITNSNPGVALKMNHALAQIAFVVYKNNYSGAGDISSIKITDATATSNLKITKAVDNDLKMALSNGSITGGDVSATVTRTLTNTIVETSDPGTDAEVLKTKVNGYIILAPATIADKTKISFSLTIDGKEYTASLTGADELAFVKGNQYLYKVKLSGTEITITGVTVTPWVSTYKGEIVIQ